MTNTNVAGDQVLSFKSKGEFEAFVREGIVQKIDEQLDKALAPLTSKQQDLMTEMLARKQSDEVKAMPKGTMFARTVRAIALTTIDKGDSKDPERVKATAVKFFGASDPVVKSIDDSIKLKATGSQAQDPTSLGNMIAPQFAAEFIALLRNTAVIRNIARTIPNPTGQLTMRRQTSAGTAYWHGEGKPITPSKPGVGTLNFSRKKLGVIYVVSNDMLRYGGSDVDAFLLQDMLAISGLAEDVSFIRGDGTQFQPSGLKSLIASANVFAQSGTTLAAVDTDFAQAKRLIEENNVMAADDDIHWLLVPRTWWGLWNKAAATDTGYRPYRDGLQSPNTMINGQLMNGRILGSPAHKTNQIPKNLGGGTNESETYCVHGPSLLIADTLNNQIDAFNGGAYYDAGSGVVVSGISNDETVIRLLREVDFNMRYQEAASMITTVTLA
jgi:HK97 family phage major capsid protein